MKMHLTSIVLILLTSVVAAEKVRCLMDDLAFPGLLRGPKSSFKNGEVFEFTCDPKYKEANVKQFRCENGDWMGPIPPCIAGSCMKPVPTVENAKAEVSSKSHLSVVKYVCEEHYALVETSQVQCLFGEWEGHPPRCEVKAAAACIENPPPISHGRGIISTRTHGSLVNYVCDNSFVKVGESQVHCVRGVWRGFLPKCIDTKCYRKDLQKAENIAPVTPNITLSGDHLNVTCDEGYTTRPVIPNCLEGKWDRNYISPCKESRCFLKDLKHSEKVSPQTANMTLSGNELDVKCEVGYLPINEKPKCVNRQWTRNFKPLCNILTCNKPPPKVSNAVEELMYTSVGSVVKYRCKEPYILEGPSQIECLFGEWKGQLPRCTYKNCADAPPNVIHATVAVISTSQKTFAKYVCKEPYLLVGNYKITCLFGEWNGTAPMCKDSRCYLNDLQADEYLAEGTPIATNTGEKLNASCKVGYTLDENRPVCQNGTWIKNSFSICKETTCSIPNLDYGDVLEEYKGEFYFNLRKLQYDRNIIHIKMPVGRIVSPGTSYLLLCHKGHVQGKAGNKSEISCIEGKWLPEPVCIFDETELTKIDELAIPGNTDSKDGKTVQSTTPVTPTAQPITDVPDVTSKCSCKYLQKDENLIATVDGKLLKQYHGVRKGAEVVFRCLHVGFHRFNGHQELQCENCKDWNVTELPRCIEPAAGNTIILFDRNINVSDEGHLEILKGQTLELICVGVERAMYPNWNAPNPDGVTIKRRRIEKKSEKIQYVTELKIDSVSKEDEGSYDCAVEDNPETTIQLFVIDPDVRCPEFPDNEQIEVTYKRERQVRSKAFFSCKKENDELIGKSAVRCLKDGEWSGPPPKCDEIKCRKLKETNLLSIYYTDDRKIGSFATFHCTSLGKRIGTRCLGNGLWSKSEPTCETDEEAPPPTKPTSAASSYDNASIPTIFTPTLENNYSCSYCTYDYSSDLVLIATVRGRKIQPGEPVREGEVISLNCRYPGMVIQWQNGLKFSGEVNLTCTGCEKWKSNELPTCETERAGGSFVVYNDKLNVLPGGIIEISRGGSFEFRCVNHWIQPEWDVGDRKGIYVEDDKILSSRKTGYFGTYMLIDEVDDEHAGTYRCFATDQIRVYEGTKMHVKISNLGETTRPINITPVAAVNLAPDLTEKCNCSNNYDSRFLIASEKKHLEVGGGVAKDTIVSFGCQDPDMKLQWPNGMKFSGKVNLRCDACQKWKRSEIPTCSFVNEEKSLLVYNDQMRILPNGKVEVPKGVSIEVRCVNSQVQPQWNASSRGGIHISSGVNDIRQKTGLYTSYMLIDDVTKEHAGEYQCSSNGFGSVTLHLQLSDDTELQCPELPQITEIGKFVIVYENDRKIDSVAQYKCRDGTSLLIGNESRVCMENGEWSGTSPKCEAPEIQCPNLPTSTKRGTFIITYENNRKLTSSAYYSCQDKTKKLIGSRQRICLFNGEWSGSEPLLCQDTTCPNHPLRNGLLAFYTNGNEIRSMVKFRCPKGKTIVGSTSSVCQADGTWSSTLPSCEDYISCDRFENPLGLEVTYSDNRRVGSRATFHCLPPHDLVGSSFAICSNEGIWSKPLPQCKGIPVCRLSREVSPQLIIDPRRDYYRFGDFALLSCPPGMRFTVQTERVMCYNEEWSHDFPDCIRDEETK